jgi:hypothetical protein
MPVAPIFHNDATTLIHNATAWNRKKRGHKKPTKLKKKKATRNPQHFSLCNLDLYLALR